MRLRVLYSDGSLLKDLLWLEHTSKDVYCGLVGIDKKVSYHSSGCRHIKSGGNTAVSVKQPPLKNFKGIHQLLSVGGTNRRGQPVKEAKASPQAQKRADAALVLDGRSMPEGCSYQVGLYLIEAFKLAYAEEHLRGMKESSCPPQQVLICTSVEPWVMAVLHYNEW